MIVDSHLQLVHGRNMVNVEVLDINHNGSQVYLVAILKNKSLINK